MKEIIGEWTRALGRNLLWFVIYWAPFIFSLLFWEEPWFKVLLTLWLIGTIITGIVLLIKPKKQKYLEYTSELLPDFLPKKLRESLSWTALTLVWLSFALYWPYLIFWEVKRYRKRKASLLAASRF